MDVDMEEIGPPPVDANHPSLLNMPPEVLNNVRSHLSLEDALRLRSTHRDLYHDCYAALRYCHLEDDEQSRRRCHVEGERTLYDDIHNCELTRLKSQDCTLVNCFRSVNKLRELLQNEAFKSRSYIAWITQKYLHSGITGNGETDAPSIALLVSLKHFSPPPMMYYDALKQDQIEVARALELDENIQREIASNLCVSCRKLPACYKCCNGREDCINFQDPPSPDAQGNMKNVPNGLVGTMYCRECVRSANLCCIACNNCVCPQCFEEGMYFSCLDCNAIICNRWWCCKDSEDYKACVNIENCNQAICSSCLPASQHKHQRWHRIGDGEFCCGSVDCCGEYCATEREQGGDFQWL
mmetsp:Transcript_30863/g.55938  ORF Transcript_30863/g.55938 Transcript_30863/m.55938 type:complete len:354 (-) Transcript_30863:69-1130(-)